MRSGGGHQSSGADPLVPACAGSNRGTPRGVPEAADTMPDRADSEPLAEGTCTGPLPASPVPAPLGQRAGRRTPSGPSRTLRRRRPSKLTAPESEQNCTRRRFSSDAKRSTSGHPKIPHMRSTIGDRRAQTIWAPRSRESRSVIVISLPGKWTAPRLTECSMHHPSSCFVSRQRGTDPVPPCLFKQATTVVPSVRTRTDLPTTCGKKCARARRIATSSSRSKWRPSHGWIGEK